jgi:uncharacterized membrane protein
MPPSAPRRREVTVFDTIAGLPLHPLVVHGVVVLVPLAAFLVIAAVVSPAVRRRAGILTPLLATAAFALLPIATQSGEAFFERLNEPDIAEGHADLGKGLWPWVLAVVVLAWIHWAMTRRAEPPHTTGERAKGRPTGAVPAVAILAIVASVAATVQVVRVGDSGARAVWGTSVQDTVPGNGESGDD